MNKPIGILGGTFDPVHYGHLRMALEVYEQLQLQEIRFIPCRQPVHKPDALVAAKHRLAMLQLALADQKNFVIDTRELNRQTPSYTIETLTTLKAEFPDTPLQLIMGNDAYLQFTTWHRWEAILEIAHLIVLTRPKYLSQNPHAYLLERITTSTTDLSSQRAGCIYPLSITPLAISSTQIRDLIQQQLNPRYLLPDSVLDYIYQHGIYTQHISQCD